MNHEVVKQDKGRMYSYEQAVERKLLGAREGEKKD